MRSSRVALPRYMALLTFLVIAALAGLPVQTASAAAPAQQTTGDAAPLQLGEFVFQALAAGESVSYQLSVPETADYRITALDEEKSIAFDLVVTDADGNELFNDIFETMELELASGEVTLQFIAVESESLEFAVFGHLGTMSADAAQPGTLLPGSIYYEDRVNEARYATLSVPATPYPQQVFIYVEPAEGDSIDVTVEGDDIGSTSMTAEQGDLLHFWSQGGDYLISAEPAERRSEFSLIPYLGGAPAAMAVDEPLDTAIVAGQTEAIFELTLAAPYDDLTIEAAADAAELNITLVDRLYDGVYFESSFWEPSLSVTSIQPGTYYVIVETEPSEEDVAVTLTATGAAGEAPSGLTSGVTATGVFAEGDEMTSYQFNVTTPGAVVTIQLASDAEDTDFDLQAGTAPDQVDWSTYTIGSDDLLTFIAPVAGQYYIGVRSNDYTGEYALTATEGDLAPALNFDVPTWGNVKAGARAVFALDVTEPGDFLTIVLIGPADEAIDLDLNISGYSADGYTISGVSGSSVGASEIVSMPLLEAGLYEIAVNGQYSDADSDFILLARRQNPNTLAGQWAIDATATSQYGDDGYAALQTTGAPNTPYAGDYDTAWASEEAEAGEQTLELTYEHAVVPYAVNIYENYNPGAVVSIEAFDAANNEWVILWEGDAQAVEERMRVFSPTLETVDFATDSIRIVLDTDAVDGWNEIDAVELAGRP